MPVLQMITSRLQVTLELTLGAMLVALAVGVPLGMRVGAAGEHRGSTTRVRLLSLFSLSIPVFWQATHADPGRPRSGSTGRRRSTS